MSYDPQKSPYRVPEGYHQAPKITSPAFSWLAQQLATEAMRIYYGHCNVYGLENLPQEGPLIYAPVHRSNADIPIVHMLDDARRGPGQRRLTAFGMKSEYLESGLVSAAFHAMGGIALERDGHDSQEFMAEIVARIMDGDSGCLYPESTRRRASRGYDVRQVDPKKARAGASVLSVLSQTPLVPVGIAGVADTDENKFRGSGVVVTVGLPLQPPGLDEFRNLDQARLFASVSRRFHKPEVIPAMQAQLDRAYSIRDQQ